jgi:hypothetical protein
MVLRAGFKKQWRLYVELKIYDKNRRKITSPQCVNMFSLTYKHVWYLLYVIMIYSFLRILLFAMRYVFIIAMINVILYIYYSISAIFLKGEFFIISLRCG